MKILAMLALLCSTAFAQYVVPTIGSPIASAAVIPSGALFGYVSSTGLTCTGGCSGTNPITAWADQSGNSNNLTSAGASNPTYTASVFGTQPAVKFNGSNSYFTFTSNPNFTGNSSACVILKKPSTGQDQYIITGANGSLDWSVNVAAGPKQQDMVVLPTGVIGAGAATGDTNAHLFCYTFNGTNNLALYIDGSSDGTATPSVTLTANETLFGCYTGPSNCTNAYVGLFYGWTRILSAGDLASMHAYAQANYGTP